MHAADCSPKRLARFNRTKRVLDVVTVIMTGPLTLALGLVTYVATLIGVGRPVLYTQRRLGYEEQEFRLLKFRTMTNASDSSGRLLPDQDRITSLGSILRKTSLDELPQLINVLRGDMSLVGPRPLFVDYKDYYLPHERKRHWVRPGITGLAQTSGRNSLLWDQRLRLDSDYVETASLMEDVRILARTVVKVFSASGTAPIASETGERLDVVRSYPSLNGFAMRRLELVDLPLRVSWFNDPRIRQYMQLPTNVTIESSQEWLRNAHKDPDRYDFVAYETASGRVVAMEGIRAKKDTPFPELYILVDPATQGKGVGNHSLALLHTWVQQLGAYRGLYLTVAEANKAAISLYERLGYQTIGRLENGARREMVWHAFSSKAEEEIA